MSTESRIAELEAQVAATQTQLVATQAELAALKAPKAARPAPPPDDGVKISVMLPVAHPKHLPTDDEYRSLHRIVAARYPALKFRNNADDEFDSFRASFQFICSLTKTAAPVTKYAPSWWIDYAQQWCRDANVPGLIRSLLPAVIACADVQYTFDDRSAFWLDPFRASGRLVDPSAWRKILGGGDLIVPTKLNVFIDHSIGLVRVQGVL
jgi:hypothetical protein